MEVGEPKTASAHRHVDGETWQWDHVTDKTETTERYEGQRG